MNRRGNLPHVPPPMGASKAVLEKCREGIDSPLKAGARILMNFIVRLRCGICELGEGFQIGLFVKVPKGSRLGKYGYIGRGFSSPSPISVGDLCMISTSVTLVGNDHGVDKSDVPIRLDFRWRHAVTVFESDSWIGHGAIIRTGVTIGRGAVVAAGAVVTKDVAPYSIVGGNPSKLIRYRFPSDEFCVIDSRFFEASCLIDAEVSEGGGARE